MDHVIQVTAYGPAEALCAFEDARPKHTYHGWLHQHKPPEHSFLVSVSVYSPNAYTIDDLRAWLHGKSDWQDNPTADLLAIPGLRLFVDLFREENQDDLIAQWLVEGGVVDNA